MEVRPEQLESALRREVPELAWVAGDEILLVQQCALQLRTAMMSDGCSERHRFTLEPGFDWNAFLQACAESSLFSPRILIELHMPEPKPGKPGGEALRKIAGRPGGGNPVLIVSGKLAKETRNSAWAKALLKTACLVTVWPVRREELPNWIRKELQTRGLQADAQAIQMLADSTEGNLLAARQEIDKLALLHPKGQLDADTLRGLLADQSRFNVFELVDAALAGDALRTLHCLQILREEGSEPIQVLWAIAREIRTLHLLNRQAEKGARIHDAMQAERIWKNRQPLVAGALKRLNRPTLDAMLCHAHEIDQSIKGWHPAEPWQGLEQLSLKLAGRPAH